MTEPTPERQDVFATTHWSVVQLAARRDTTRAQQALSTLCAEYWYPLYAYVRRQGHSAHDAQDLTQEFFARLLAANSIATVDPAKGRFRSWLLASMKHFLANEWDRARAAKRGGGHVPISLDEKTAEERYRFEPAHELSADRIFERRWALLLLDSVLQELEQQCGRDGKLELFTVLKPCLAGSRESQPYAELSRMLGMTEGSVKVAVHRLRQEYRALLRRKIADTVSSPSEIDDEIRHLYSVLS